MSSEIRPKEVRLKQAKQYVCSLTILNNEISIFANRSTLTSRGKYVCPLAQRSYTKTKFTLLRRKNSQNSRDSTKYFLQLGV